MGGERRRIGNDPVDDEPFIGTERVEAPLPNATLERRPRLLHDHARGGDRAGRLPGVLRRNLDHTYAVLLERPAHPFGQAIEPCDGELFCCFSDSAQPADGPAPAYRRGDVRPYDRRDS